MKHSALLIAAFAAVLFGIESVLGYQYASQIAYGSIWVMAFVISASFLWLWWERTTPLALGMALSWAGAGLVLFWWWSQSVANRPEWMLENRLLLAFCSVFAAGAVLHLRVIRSTAALSRTAILAIAGVGLLVLVSAMAVAAPG